VLANYQSNNQLRGSSQVRGKHTWLNWNGNWHPEGRGRYQNRYDDLCVQLNSEQNIGGYIGLNKGWGYSHLQ
jgi:iron complex outermembrane receptor protein